MKTDLTFILNILNNHIQGYKHEYDAGLLSFEKMDERITALKAAGKAIVSYVEEANKLTEKLNESQVRKTKP